MTQDPYGFHTDREEAPPRGIGRLLGLLVTGVSLLLCLGGAGVGVLFGVTATEDRLVDHVGIGLMGSVLAWPAAGVGLWSLGFMVVTRRTWPQLGPNLLLGVLTGLVAWFLVCGGVALYAGVTDGT